MQILSHLLTRDFRSTIGRLSVNVVTVHVDVEHHNRNVRDSCQVYETLCLKRSKNVRISSCLSEAILDKSSSIDDTHCKEKEHAVVLRRLVRVQLDLWVTGSHIS